MRSGTLVSLFAGLAPLTGASPVSRRQAIPFDLAVAADDVVVPSNVTGESVVFDKEDAAKSVAEDLLAGNSQVDVSDSVTAVDGPAKREVGKRAACAAQPQGSGDVPTPDTAEAFASYPGFASAANDAAVPDGYTRTFQNLGASNNANFYMGFSTLKSYDVQLCSKKCDAIYGCAAFNIYFERDPTVEPGTDCPNPPSTTNIKCVFWGGPVTAENAQNRGQWRNKFQVLVAGSNGYVNKTIEGAAGYTQPTPLGNAAISAPNDCNGKDSWIQTTVLTGGPFDAGLCAAACDAQTKLAQDDKTAKSCKFFNTYLLLKNGKSVGQYCAMYSQTWASSYATNKGGPQGSDSYTVAYSYSFTNAADNGIPVCPADVSYLSAKGQEFCTSFNSYVLPTSTVVSTVMPATSTILTTTTPLQTIQTTVVKATTVTTMGKQFQYKRDLAEFAQVVPVSTTPAALDRRAVPTPASITSWPSSKIAAACSAILTGTTTVTSVTSAATPLTTKTVTASAVVVTRTIETTQTAVQTICPSIDTTSPPSADKPFYMAVQGLPWGVPGATQYITLRWQNLWIVPTQPCATNFTIDNSIPEIPGLLSAYTNSNGEKVWAVQGSPKDIVLYNYNIGITTVLSGGYYYERWTIGADGTITATQQLRQNWYGPPQRLILQVCPDQYQRYGNEGDYNNYAPYLAGVNSLQAGCTAVTLKYAGTPM